MTTIYQVAIPHRMPAKIIVARNQHDLLTIEEVNDLHSNRDFASMAELATWAQSYKGHQRLRIQALACELAEADSN